MKYDLFISKKDLLYFLPILLLYYLNFLNIKGYDFHFEVWIIEGNFFTFFVNNFYILCCVNINNRFLSVKNQVLIRTGKKVFIKKLQMQMLKISIIDIFVFVLIPMCIFNKFEPAYMFLDILYLSILYLLISIIFIILVDSNNRKFLYSVPVLLNLILHYLL